MNNPYKYVDPFGLWAVTMDAGGGAGGGPAAGSVGFHAGISYSNEYGLQAGFYGSESFGWSYLFGAEYFLGGSVTPNAKQFSDQFGESTTKGASAAFVHGGSLDKSVSTTNPEMVTYSAAYSPGIAFEIHKFKTDSSGSSITIATSKQLNDLKNKLASNNQQATNANSANSLTNRQVNTRSTQSQGKIDKAVNKIKATVNKVVSSVKRFFGGKR